MYMIYLIENHIPKNENQCHKKQQAFFAQRNNLTPGILTINHKEDFMKHFTPKQKPLMFFCMAVTTLFFFLTAGSGAGMAAITMTDTNIEIAVEDELMQDQAVPSYLVNIQCTEGIVTLTGSVNTLLAKERARAIAETVKGVRSVVNRIEVTPEIQKTDMEIQTDVADALFADPVTESFEIDVSVNDNLVTLEGKVDSYLEKKAAEKVAKSIGGVTEVKNLVTYDYKTSRSDAELASEIKAALQWDTLVDDALVQVSVKNRKVSLTGIVGSAAEKRRAMTKAWLPAGIKDVDASRLTVARWARDRDLRTEKYVQKSDDKIKEAVDKAILYDPRVLSTQVNTRVENGRVTLTGRVNTLSAKQAAAQDVRNTVGVIRVKNQIKVTPPAQPVSSQELEQTIVDKFRRDAYVDNFEITVNALGGMVSLYGTVDTYYEKARAEDLASEAKGVYSVNNNLIVQRDWDSYVYKPYVDDSYIYDYDWYSYQPNVSVTKDDQAIKDNIESELFWSPFVDSDQVTVMVDDGKATLTGQVDSWSEYDAAAQNALEGGAVAVDNELTISSVNL
jgi:osmotically-inducible protein OsmY